MKTRLLALLLALLTVTILLVACSDFVPEETEDEKDPVTTADPGTTQDPATTTVFRTDAPAGTTIPKPHTLPIRPPKTAFPITVAPPVSLEPGVTTTAPTTAPPVTTTAPITTTAPVTTPPLPEGVDAKWAGYTKPDGFDTLYIAYNDVVNNQIAATGTGNSMIYLQGPDEETGDLSRGDYKAAYERHARVCDVLGLTIGESLVYTTTGWDYNCDSILPTIEAYNCANMDDMPNIVIHQNYGMVRAAITGNLYNVLDDDPRLNDSSKNLKNWFDLDAEGWYTDMMWENSLDADGVYMLMGDYFIDQLRYSHGVLVNADMIEESCAAFSEDGGMEYLYDLVRNGEWTYDVMLEIAEYCYNEDGSEPIMGVIGDKSWTARSFFASSGLDIFTKDASGELFYIDGEGAEVKAIHDWLDSLIAMQKEEFFDTEWNMNASFNPDRDTVFGSFVKGRSAFALNQMLLTLESPIVLSMDAPASIVPTPMYPETAESMWRTDADGNAVPDYRALVSDNANSGGILLGSSFADFSVASAFLQLMTEQSDEVVREYYDVGMKIKNNVVGPGHVDMLDIIRDGICSPASFLYDNYCVKSIGTEDIQTYGWIMNDIISSGSNTFVSSWRAQYRVRFIRWEHIKSNYAYE